MKVIQPGKPQTVTCPKCNRELGIEVEMATTEGVRVVLVCPVHGTYPQGWKEAVQRRPYEEAQTWLRRR
jgi:hypothetical protein